MEMARGNRVRGVRMSGSDQIAGFVPQKGSKRSTRRRRHVAASLELERVCERHKSGGGGKLLLRDFLQPKNRLIGLRSNLFS
jgi:hypothetical protein